MAAPLLLCASASCWSSACAACAICAVKTGFVAIPGRAPTVAFRMPPPTGSLSESGLRACLSLAGVSVRARYDFVKGSDGLLYLVNQDEKDQAGWNKCLENLRTSVAPILGILKQAPDDTITSETDERVSQSQFKRLQRLLNDKTYSGVCGMSSNDLTGFYALTPCSGGAVFLTSKDYYAKGWRQQNIVYLLHELCHAAMGGPPELVAHNLEFFRLMHVLTQAAISLGPKVYNPAWYTWDISANRQALGGWIGTDAWWDYARSTIKNGYTWRGATLVRGKDPFVPGNGTLVKVP